MDELTGVFDLPLQTLASLAAGYVGYRIAYTARDMSHKTIDVVFMVTVFAFFARAASHLASLAYNSVFVSVETPISQLTSLLEVAGIMRAKTQYEDILFALFGILVAVATAAFWRASLETRVKDWLDHYKISSADRTETAWLSIIQRSDVPLTGITIVKTDGSAIACDKLSLFKDLKHGPCIFGDDGSIALYVTAVRNKLGGDWENSLPYDEDWGIEMTYVSKTDISEVRVSHPASFSGEVLAELKALLPAQSV